MTTNYASGHYAEFLALNYLRLKGYSLVAQNYITGKGTHAGEVDLIVKKCSTLVFVEVKKRCDLTAAAYAISVNQQMRIRRAAEAFLAQHDIYQNFDIRFDAVLVQLPLTIQHLENAW